MLQNVRVTAFTISELLRENQQRGDGGVEGGGDKKYLFPTTTQIRSSTSSPQAQMLYLSVA